jgi:large subunit ribosomal protein L9
MEVILLESIDGLGRKGAIVKVKDGYGRNYLLPANKAMVANKDNMQRLRGLSKTFALEEAKLLTEVKEIAANLQGKVIELEEKATEEGHLFGSVSVVKLVQALDEMGFKVTEKAVGLGETIKAVGTYPVTIHLHPEVDVDITVTVTPEGGVREPEPAEEPAAEGETTESAEEEQAST